MVSASRRAAAPCVTRGLRQAQPDKKARPNKKARPDNTPPSVRACRGPLVTHSASKFAFVFAEQRASRVTRVARAATPEFANFFCHVIFCHPSCLEVGGRDDGVAGRLRRRGARMARAPEQPSDRSAMDG